MASSLVHRPFPPWAYCKQAGREGLEIGLVGFCLKYWEFLIEKSHPKIQATMAQSQLHLTSRSLIAWRTEMDDFTEHYTPSACWVHVMSLSYPPWDSNHCYIPTVALDITSQFLGSELRDSPSLYLVLSHCVSCLYHLATAHNPIRLYEYQHTAI